jgi:large subunit ribosomal protein L6
MPVEIPNGVTVNLQPGLISAKGPKGEDEVSFSDIVKVEQADNQIVVTRDSDEKEARSQHGLVRALIQNMMIGVTEGFSKDLEIIGTGYTVVAQHGGLLINVGYSHPVFVGPVEGIDYKVNGNTSLTVSGVSKYMVGEVSAKIRSIRPPEPFKGKGIRYKDEYVRRKAGKTVGA